MSGGLVIAALGPVALALAAVAVVTIAIRRLGADDRHYRQHMKGSHR